MLEAIRAILIGDGYDVASGSDGLVDVRDPESGILTRAVLEGQVLYMSVPCITGPSHDIGTDILRKMLAADNGISTSSFQLVDVGEGRTLSIDFAVASKIRAWTPFSFLERIRFDRVFGPQGIQ